MLEEVDVRKLWSHEQYDFSNWLAKEENIDLLNEALGLTLVDIEKLIWELLEDLGDPKGNYADYMTTEPINCNEELQHVANADYELCTA